MSLSAMWQTVHQYFLELEVQRLEVKLSSSLHGMANTYIFDARNTVQWELSREKI